MTNTPTPATEVQINFMQIRRPADIGIARASVFLGLATNAAAVTPPLSHVLDDKVLYGFVPKEVSAATAANFSEEFTYWVIGNSLRELVESFSIFLVACRPWVRVMETRQFDASELSQLAVEIEKKNISEQYREIQGLVGLDLAYAEMFETLRQARNCLAHRRGIVAQRDVNTEDGHLKLSWCFAGIFLRTADGAETKIDNDRLANGGLVVDGEGGASVVVRTTWNEKKFSVGTQIRLTRHDLGEICFGVHLATTHVVQKMHDFARAHGIPDAGLEEAAQATVDVPPVDQELENLNRAD